MKGRTFVSPLLLTSAVFVGSSELKPLTDGLQDWVSLLSVQNGGTGSEADLQNLQDNFMSIGLD